MRLRGRRECLECGILRCLMLERGFQLVDELLDALLLNSELALLLLVDRLYRDEL